MKSFFRFFTALATVLAAGSAFAGPLRTVIIDAGHGGQDNGAQVGKVYEKHLALDTAYRLKARLQKLGYQTVMTRSNDYFVSLQQRTQIANSYRNAIFVSIHFNHTWRENAAGLETFYFNAGGQNLAHHVQNGIIRNTHAADRQAKFARFYVIRNTRLPGILVEGGFVSNDRERDRMKSAAFRESIAKGVAEGIQQFNRRPGVL